MQSGGTPDITSRFSGIAYRDLLYYFIPGFSILAGICVCFDWFENINTWIADSGTGVTGSGEFTAKAILLLFAIPAFSFILGVISASIRLFIFDRFLFKGLLSQVSLGKYLYGRLLKPTNRKKLPPEIREKAIKLINKDIKELKIFRGYGKERLDLKNLNDSMKKRKKNRISENNSIELLDIFWLILLDSSRNEMVKTREYYDRSSAVSGYRRNATVAAIIFVTLWIIALLSETARASVIVPVSTPIATLGFLLVVYKWVIPSFSYANLRDILLSYLVGNIKVCSEDEKQDEKKYDQHFLLVSYKKSAHQDLITNR